MGDLAGLILQYLNEAKLMQLSTSENGQPWTCSVWFASDWEFNLYYLSSLKRRHSVEVEKNPKVSGAIVLQQKPADSPRGIQFQGVASLLSDPKDVEKALSVYVDRIFSRGKIDDFIKNGDHGFYRIKPSVIVLFDAVNFPDNPRQELRLP